MLVVKFGGTSVGKPERMKKIGDLVLSLPGKKIVVLSALSGTTNTLVKIGDHLMAKEGQKANYEIEALEKHYKTFVTELFNSAAYTAIGQEIVSRYFSLFRLLAAGRFDDRSYRELLAQGELISTELFYHHLQERKVDTRLLPALHFSIRFAREIASLTLAMTRNISLLAVFARSGVTRQSLGF